MPEEPTTPDPVELSRRFHEVASRLDFDAMVSFYAPDAVWEGRASGMTFEGRTAIRGFWEDATAAYEEFEFQREETLDLGNGVIFDVTLQKGRPVDSISYVQLRYAAVVVWAKGLIERVTLYGDPDEARAAAERLAEERGWAMSQENMELYRSYIEDIRAGTSADPEATISKMAERWDPEIEQDASEAPALDLSGVCRGTDAVRQWWREWFGAWEALQFEYALVEAGDRVVGLLDLRMRGRSTGIEVAVGKHAWVNTFRDGLIVHSKLYMSQSEALKAVGLAE